MRIEAQNRKRTERIKINSWTHRHDKRTAAINPTNGSKNELDRDRIESLFFIIWAKNIKESVVLCCTKSAAGAAVCKKESRQVKEPQIA